MMGSYQVCQYAADELLLTQLLSIANSGHLYYGTSFDLTHSLQQNWLKATRNAGHTTIDDRYFFNSFLQRPILDGPNTLAPWVTRVICGYVGMIDLDVAVPPATTINAKEPTVSPGKYTAILISRLSQRRLGPRYVCRGIDFAGNAANNVEMEQIVFPHDFAKHKSIASYVQLRGSVPTVWGQELDLSYRPRLLLANQELDKVWNAIRRHFHDLRNQYTAEKTVVQASGSEDGKVVCVNLLDDEGFEAPLTAAYEKSVKRLQDSKITYEGFPLNKWCKRMNFKNLDILVDRVRLRIQNNGWFLAEGDVPSIYSIGTLRCTRLQTGVARVSCLDSLDRTNLVCSLFARFVLAFQVQSVSPGLASVHVFLTPSTGVSPTDVLDPVADVRKSIESHSQVFTNLWADAGDAISLVYAGTRALKADITRTGKRQIFKGTLDDGINSLTRYYLNHFNDGDKQDGYDVWSGKADSDQLSRYVSIEGGKTLSRSTDAVVDTKKGLVSKIVPPLILRQLDTILYETNKYLKQYPQRIEVRKGKAKPVAHIDDTGDAVTIGGFLVVLLKRYMPSQIHGLVDFVLAAVLFVYLVVFVKFFRIPGQTVVNQPKINHDQHAKLVALVK